MTKWHPCRHTTVSMGGMFCVTKGCQQKNQRDGYGRPTFANGDLDEVLWNAWQISADKRIRKEVESIKRRIQELARRRKTTDANRKGQKNRSKAKKPKSGELSNLSLSGLKL